MFKVNVESCRYLLEWPDSNGYPLERSSCKNNKDDPK